MVGWKQVVPAEITYKGAHGLIVAVCCRFYTLPGFRVEADGLVDPGSHT